MLWDHVSHACHARLWQQFPLPEYACLNRQPPSGIGGVVGLDSQVMLTMLPTCVLRGKCFTWLVVVQGVLAVLCCACCVVTCATNQEVFCHKRVQQVGSLLLYNVRVPPANQAPLTAVL